MIIATLILKKVSYFLPSLYLIKEVFSSLNLIYDTIFLVKKIRNLFVKEEMNDENITCSKEREYRSSF